MAAAPGATRARKAGGRVVDHQHSAARRCGSSRMALPELGLPWDDLFPRRTPTAAPLTRCSKPSAAARRCRRMVDLLALAHEQCCEARLAADYRRAARRRATARARPPQRPLRRGPAPARHAAQADCACRPCGRHGESFTDRADRDGWPTARLLAAPATRSPTASASASSGTGPRRSCRRARRWRPSTSPSSRRCRRRECACWRAAMSGSGNGRTCSCSARPERAKCHLASGLGLALVENGFRVLYQRTGTGAGTASSSSSQ